MSNIEWNDLTVDNAEEIRDFYMKVIGWKSQAFSMGDYDDYVMMPAVDDVGIAGICHKKGVNSNIPSQ